MLYHEKQVAALCGVHCLNTLLQGPYFNEIDLAQIAQGLDELERALVGDGALGEGSGNVAMDGMFSIQVLSRALESWGLQVVSLESEEARQYKAAPTTATAFICNLHEHWFTLRRVAGEEWWNFNSLWVRQRRAGQGRAGSEIIAAATACFWPLSIFYLQAFLDTLREEGWTIFVPGSLDQLPNTTGRWWIAEEPTRATTSIYDLDYTVGRESRGPKPKHSARVGSTQHKSARAANDEAERARKRGRLANALEGAFAQAERQGGQLQLRSRVGGPAGSRGDGADGGIDDDDDDEDLAAAIAASLQSSHHTSHAAAAQQQQQQQERQRLQGVSHAPPAGGGDGGGRDVYGEMYDDEYDDDPELAAAIAASLAESSGLSPPAQASEVPPGVAAAAAGRGAHQQQQQGGEVAEEGEEDVLGPEPEAEGEAVIELAFSRRFSLTSPSAALFAYTGPLLGLQPARVALSTAFPKKDLERSRTITLGDLGLTHRTMLVAEPKK
ncbi:hypothetical protein VOLCADRAFT_95901 [Volvox carteri f. nagariensis]|uniref:Ataxin-3 homolog n=1 Tax=Volvox carteri f. nagariensis TaxID=3068 RepID=D8U8N8_VOLCA|nr:uncharacterized protein VOLCADRAFT_95901 [Volvox carteri f. nagariensis]EFJ43953.1 hypothetical protein VOLCADRAFT_95901 [Volvox carteri f. nagariensis]|eukprot:XP_002954965.1 hypothetical protein VOLCADRAFT_95901 [Volvox carteri f. nagariensis]